MLVLRLESHWVPFLFTFNTVCQIFSDILEAQGRVGGFGQFDAYIIKIS